MIRRMMGREKERETTRDDIGYDDIKQQHRRKALEKQLTRSRQRTAAAAGA